MFTFTKKRLANLILISLAALSITAAIFYSTDSSILSNSISHDSNCQWHHYNEIAPTYTKNGVKEYWICCQHHDVTFKKPDSGSISDSTHPSGFVDTISSGDSYGRYMKPYNQGIDFEDDYIPSFISNTSNVYSLSIASNQGTNNSNALAIKVKSGTYRVYFSKVFLDQMFSDNNVQAIFFDAKSDYVSSNFRHGNPSSNFTYEYNNANWGLELEYKTFAFTRAYYNSYVSSDSFLYGVAVDGAYIYIDNIRSSTTALSSYGFENGRMVSPTVSGYEHKVSLRFFDSTKEYFVAQGDPITSYSFDYSMKTEGNRSLKFTKSDGYISLYLPNLYSSLADNAIIYIDVYSTVDANATLGAQNILDGVNLASYGGISKNQWTTLSIMKGQIQSDGRFMIITGSTSGEWYFDNIRVVSYTTSTDSNYTNLGNIVLESTANDQGIAFTTKHSITGIKAIYIDNGIATYTKITIGDIKNNTFKIRNSSFADGAHTLQVTYLSGTTIYNDYFYLETKIADTSKAAINLSATYGTSDYYTLTGYSGIYRITCGTNEVPFEISGSDYLIPTGSLIQLLPESNKQKISGQIKLYLYSLSKVYTQIFNITLSGGENTKTIKEYNGPGIPTHAYSSTSSYARVNNYETYYSKEKVAEYDNTGLTFMYEQAIHYPASATTFTPALKYLLNNAYVLGQKVMIVDDAFQTLAKKTESFMGQTLSFAGKNYTFNTSTDVKNFCKERLSTYVNEPGLGGICFIDEPTYAMLAGGLNDLVKPFKQALQELGKSDLYFSINLLPMFAGSQRLIGADSPTDEIANYRTYVEKYFEITDNDYLQFDVYPLATIEKGNVFADKEGGNPTGISLYGLSNIIHAVELAKEHDAELHMVTQSFAYNGIGDRVLNQADIAFLNNTILGMGVKRLSYFVYCNRAVTGSEETWYDDGAFLTKDGVRNNVYYYYQSMIHQINNFGPVISSFDFESWAKFISSGTKSASRYYTYAQTLMGSSYYNYDSYYSTIKSAEITSGSDYAFLTALKNNSTNDVMYMVQNAYNHFGTSDMLQTIKLRFKQKYTYAYVFENGLARIVNLTDNDFGLIIRRDISLTLSAGHAAFIIPF